MAEYTDEEARKAIKRLARKDREDSRKSGTIISVRGRKASVVIEGENSVVSAHRGLFEPIIGAYVAIELIPGTQNWKIVGVGDAALAATDTLPYDIEYQGTPIYYPIALEAINNGAYNLAATGLEMTVYNIQYVNENGVFHFIESTLLDFLASVPVSDSRWSVVCVETADDSVVIYDDSPTATPDGEWITAVNAAVAANPTYLPVLAIRLNSGMTDWGDGWKRINRGYSFDNKKIVRVAYPTVPGETGTPITDAYYQYIDADGTPQVQRGTVNFESTDTIEVLVTDSGVDDETIVSFALVNSANSFLGLSDAPHDYTGEAGKVVRVNATEDGVEFYAIPAGVADFTDLADVPAAYTGHSLKAVRVNAGETALEFYTPSFAADFTDLGDVPASYTGHSLKFVRVNAGETALEFAVGGGGAVNFTDLADVPASYVGEGGKAIRVAATETALEFFTVAGGVTEFTDLDDVPNTYVGEAGNLVRVNATEDALEFHTLADFTDLADVPSSYTGHTLKAVRVNAGETALEFYTPVFGAVDFINLGDVPASYTGHNGKAVVVNPGANGLTFEAKASEFTDLTDVPSTYSGQALKAVRVNAGASALEFYTPTVGATAFTGLSDVPASYSGQALKLVRVNAGATALEFSTAPVIPVDFTDLADVPSSYSGLAGRAVFVNGTEDGVDFQTIKVTSIVGLPSSLTGAAGDSIRVNVGETAYEFYTPAAGVADFTDLADVPSSYAGQALKSVRVNAGATALEFYTAAGGVSNFTDLGDVPASYTGHGDELVKVNTGETALEFVALTPLSVTKVTTELAHLHYANTLGASGSFQAITALPSGYDRVKIRMHVRGTVAAASDIMNTTINGDTTAANYHYQVIAGVNNVANAAELDTRGSNQIPAASSTADAYADFEIDIEGYASTAHRKNVVTRRAEELTADNQIIALSLVVWQSSSAITDIAFTTDNDPTDQFVAGSWIEVWLYKSVDVVTDVTGDSGGTAKAFIELSDAPASYASQGNKIVTVNNAANAVAFTDFDSLVGIKPHLCMGRLTLVTGTPIMTSNVTAQTTVYFTPFHGNTIRLYDGSVWKYHTFTERSLSLSGYTADKNYDIFIYDNAGTLTLESAIWTNDTTRASAITLQDGVYVKSGATTRLLLGTVRINSTGGQTDFTANGNKLYLSNVYNRVPRTVRATDSTDSWTYATATWRYARNSAANRIEYVDCLGENIVEANVLAIGGASGAAGAMGVGVDVSNANSAQFMGQLGGTTNVVATSNYKGFPGIGFHFLAWIEYTRTGTMTYYGDAGVATMQTGLHATIYC